MWLVFLLSFYLRKALKYFFTCADLHKVEALTCSGYFTEILLRFQNRTAKRFLYKVNWAYRDRDWKLTWDSEGCRDKEDCNGNEGVSQLEIFRLFLLGWSVIGDKSNLPSKSLFRSWSLYGMSGSLFSLNLSCDDIKCPPRSMCRRLPWLLSKLEVSISGGWMGDEADKLGSLAFSGL